MTFFGEYSSVLLKSLDKIMSFLADILVWFWGLPEDFVPFLNKLWLGRYTSDFEDFDQTMPFFVRYSSVILIDFENFGQIMICLPIF